MNGTKTMDWLKCNICFNIYNGTTQRPRSLSCGHTFCEGCLNSTLQNEFLSCPQCRKIHKINSVLDLPINFTLEGILKSLSTCSVDVSEVVIQEIDKDESTIDHRSGAVDCLGSFVDYQQKNVLKQKEVQKIMSGICHDHPSMKCMYRCSLHMCWVCKECIEEEGDHSKNKCNITSFMEEIEQRKQVHIESLEDEEELCDEVLVLIQKHILHLEHEREHHINLGNKLKDLVCIHKKEEDNLMDQINSYRKNIEKGKKVKEKLLENKASVMNATTLDESNAARDMVKNKKVVARNWINTSQKEVFVSKLMIANSTLAVSTEKSLKHRESELMELNNNVELNGSEIDIAEGGKCNKKVQGGGFFYSCLQCRTDDTVVLCGTCFANSEHVNHIHEIDRSNSWTCDCGTPELWKRNPTCMKHLKNVEFTTQPYNKYEYASSICKEIFSQGEKMFSCLDCRNSNYYVLCGSCLINTEHRYHTYEILTSHGRGGFCDCGRKESWKSEHTCEVHNNIDKK